MEINYKTSDNSIEIKLQYIVKAQYKNYPGIGKCWPITTQCILFYNGLVLDFASVTKHNFDTHNPEYAHRLVTKKVLEKINIKFIRKDIWKLIDEFFKKENNKNK